MDVGPRIAEARTTRSFRSVGWWPRRSHQINSFFIVGNNVNFMFCFELFLSVFSFSTVLCVKRFLSVPALAFRSCDVLI